MKIFKKLIFTLTLLILFSFSVSTGSAQSNFDPQNCKDPQPNWPQHGGFSIDDCPYGLGYPAMNAANNEEMFEGAVAGTSNKNSEFIRVQNENDKSNKVFNSTTSVLPNSEVRFVGYIHNFGNAGCNDKLIQSECSELTSAKNLKIKVSEGLSLVNGKVQSDWGTEHKITFQLTADNTYPKTISHTVTIFSETPGRLIMNHDTTKNYISHPLLNRVARVYSPSELLSGIPLKSVHSKAIYPNDFYASINYRQLIYGQFYYEEALVCEALTLNRTTFVVGNRPNLRVKSITPLILNNPETKIEWVIHTGNSTPPTTSFPDILSPGKTFKPDRPLTINDKVIATWIPPGNPNSPGRKFPCQAEVTPEPLPQLVCEELTLTKNESSTPEAQIYDITIEPSNFPKENIGLAGHDSDSSNINARLSNNKSTLTITEFNENDIITVFARNSDGTITPACKQPITFEKPPIPVCDVIKMQTIISPETGKPVSFFIPGGEEFRQPANELRNTRINWYIIPRNTLKGTPTATLHINNHFQPDPSLLTPFTTIRAEWINHTPGKDKCFDQKTLSEKVSPPTIPVPKFACNNLERSSVQSNETTGKTTISYKVTPSNLAGKLQCTDSSADIKEVKILGLASTGRATVTIDTSRLDNLVCYISESTEVTNGACTDSFTPTPPPEEDLFCESLTETGIKVDEEAGTTTIAYLVEPTSFEKPLKCDVQPANLTVEIADHNQTRIVTVNSTEIESLDCYIDEGANTQPACRQTYTSPKEPPVEEKVCKSFDLIPTKFNTGDQPEFKISNIAPVDFEGKVIWKINGRNQATQDIQDSFTPDTPLKSSDIVTVEWEDHVNGEDGCYDQASSEEEPDTPDEPEKPEVCEELKVYSTKTVRAVQINSTHRLPGALQWDSYTFETVPAKYQSDITVTPSNIALSRDRDTYYAFNGGNSARLSFNGPTPECSLELSGLRNPGPDFELIKKINNKNTNHDIVNVNTPIEYTVELKEVNGKLPSLAKVDFSDIIQIKDEIKGKNQEAGLNKNYGTLNLISRFNQNKLKNFWSYQGLVNWDNRNYDCSQFRLDCSVSYKNRASVTITMPGIPVRPTTPNNQTITIDSNPTYAIIMCPFVLSRGFGDVYLEDGLSSGVNVQACGARNTQSPVFTKPPAPTQEIVATGANEPSHAVCQDPTSWNTNPELQKIFNPDKLSNFSSSVCEVAINNSERWQKETINKNLINIFAKLQPENKVTSTNPTLLTIGDNSALRSYKGLTLGTGSEINIEGNSARTIVVYGDLLINSNLKYTQSSKGTVAFVVIGGDIKVKPGVTHLEGIFVTIPKNSTGGSFLWQTESNAEKVPAIEIKGSAYGNIDALFEGVTESGDLSKDRGQVTTIFDGRIIRKIPPGLQDVIKFNQFQTATQSSYFTQTAE